MTVLVYKDGKMAADGRATVNELIYSDEVVKVFKTPGVIAGGSGDLDEVQKLKEWINNGADLKVLKSGAKIWGIVVYKELSGLPRVYRIEEGGYYELPIKKGEFICSGAGREVAYGALEMGATVEEAVEAAKKHIVSCGGTTTVVTL